MDRNEAAEALMTEAMAGASEAELHQVVGHGDQVAVLVFDADGDEGEVVAIGVDG